MGAMTLPIDHLVLPVKNLDAARERFSTLGFTVAPDGIHPFGTVNCCVYLKGGTFLEPLAVGDRAVAEAAIRDGNVFVARDSAYRTAHGDEGFSALVFGTADAGADDRRFRDLNISAGNLLEFSRPFIVAVGRADTASFRLAFAAQPEAESTFFFTVERMSAPKVDRSAMEKHANGVVGLKGVVVVAKNPAAHRDFLQNLTASDLATGVSGFEIETDTGTVFVLQLEAARQRYGIATAADNTLRLCAAIFGVAELAATEKLFKANAISYEKRDKRILVPPAPGQGTFFVFEATR
jgi:catechol 2,3-dioxygenase-like lactoylglutathione lyase family enzyme